MVLSPLEMKKIIITLIKWNASNGYNPNNNMQSRSFLSPQNMRKQENIHCEEPQSNATKLFPTIPKNCKNHLLKVIVADSRGSRS